MFMRLKDGKTYCVAGGQMLQIKIKVKVDVL